ncbi:hypothetical protein [Engelhardtia mirabilis]|uniref:Uncharacterized protein n=1 Tax=Engelhardtia mirabilis TaxID=2528011 RepID=A0A518BF76_9BACT|nr:hypothetical protein Pla133_06990 [Planctomycetes bacterium Pla133]QDU99959.1 hypothetical protein Pla86_06980 [Planctomycetes bacterium Pla86]
MQIAKRLLLLWSLAALAGCLSFSFHDNRSSGSYEDDDLRVSWDLRRGGGDARVRRIDALLEPGAAVQEVEILVLADEVEVERWLLRPVEGENRRRVRNLRVPGASEIRLQVLVVPTDGSDADLVVDAGLTVVATPPADVFK